MSNELTELSWGVYIVNGDNRKLIAAFDELRQAEQYGDMHVGPTGQDYLLRLMSEVRREQQPAAPATQPAADQAIQALREYQVGFEDGSQSGRRYALQDVFHRVKFMRDCLPESATAARNQLAAVTAMIESLLKGHYVWWQPAEPAAEDQRNDDAYLLSMIIPEGCVTAVDGRMLYVIDPSKDRGK